jgi:hypothetical protein
MVSEVGAPLWHMSGLEFNTFCHVKPSEEFGVAFNSALVGGIVVNRAGKRFFPETLYISHRKIGHPALEINYDTGKYLNLPAFLIFDETTRLKGPVAGRGNFAPIQGARTTARKWRRDGYSRRIRWVNWR